MRSLSLRGEFQHHPGVRQRFVESTLPEEANRSVLVKGSGQRVDLEALAKDLVRLPQPSVQSCEPRRKAEGMHALRRQRQRLTALRLGSRPVPIELQLHPTEP